MLSAVGASRNAKRAAIIHFLFNSIGAVIFGAIFTIYFMINPLMGTANVNSVQLALFHTCFNVLNTIVLFRLRRSW